MLRRYNFIAIPLRTTYAACGGAGHKSYGIICVKSELEPSLQPSRLSSLMQFNRIILEVLLERSQTSTSILSGPLDKISSLWAIVAEVLEV